MSKEAERMMKLFAGFEGAHGTHGQGERNSSKGGKLEIKGTARTIREPVTVRLWEEHLAGERAIGVIPIREDGTCQWGCIDIDVYDIDHIGLIHEIEKRGLPLVVCKSKSGGAHLYLFLSSPLPAQEVQLALRNVAASMGYGGSEIFPKQSRVLAEKGDIGNWMSMPYFSGNDTQKYAVKKTLTAMTVSEFLDHAESRRVGSDALEEMIGGGQKQDELLEEGPPCLQHLGGQGFPEGTRNNGLFSMGIFCQKKFGDRWEEMLEECNRKYMDPPLSSEEVVGVIKSLKKKEYNYPCKEQPICSHCNSTVCRQRRFGVGGSGLWPVISGMSKLEAGEDTLWFVDIEDIRLEVTTRQLQNYREFQMVCMYALTKSYLPMKAGDWAMVLADAMEKVNIIEAAPDQTAPGHFFELLEEFLTNRYVGKSMSDLLQGKPYHDEEEQRHYFRLKDLMEHLDRENFKRWGRNKVSQTIQEMGGREFKHIDGKGVNILWVPERFQEMPRPKLPEGRQEAI